MPYSVRYHFVQDFSVPARQAYYWCTDFNSTDFQLIGNSTCNRQVDRLADCTILLTDTFQTKNSKVRKQKLIQLYPDRLFWTSTHLLGINKYSQILYQILADSNDSSHLDFDAIYLNNKTTNINLSQARSIADNLCRQDIEVWQLLAKAMKKELVK